MREARFVLNGDAMRIDRLPPWYLWILPLAILAASAYASIAWKPSGPLPAWHVPHPIYQLDTHSH